MRGCQHEIVRGMAEECFSGEIMEPSFENSNEKATDDDTDATIQKLTTTSSKVRPGPNIISSSAEMLLGWRTTLVSSVVLLVGR